ncbi:nodulation protein NfeD [Caulobacter sp. 17J80-11]|nr:nodulation protein NfeD [Caulobacter sp. 17J80-11]
MKTAAARNAALVIIRLDTPGGLESSTRDIVHDILASPVPVATYVAPSGARAASAGTYILYASHLAAMAPGTHLGAATPVQIGGGGSPLGGGAGEGETKPPAADAETSKVVNDAAAYLTSLAALQGRNAKWAERAVREAATLTADEALKQDVVEIVARDVPDLLAQADGRTVKLNGQLFVLKTAGARVVAVEPDWRSRFLGVITNPNIAYLLLLVGVYGLIFEFLTPGTVGPGVVGAIALVVGLFALNLLPVSYAGLGLIVIGIGLLVAEAHAPSGACAAGGTVALALGSLMLFRAAGPEYRLSPGVILVGVGVSLAFFLVVIGAAVRSRRLRVRTGGKALIGAPAEVLRWSGTQGTVRVEGEDWRAHAKSPLAPGQAARVTSRDGLTLTVEPEPRSPQ